MMFGRTTDNRAVPMQVDSSGVVQTTAAGGGSAATSANQLTQISYESQIAASTAETNTHLIDLVTAALAGVYGYTYTVAPSANPQVRPDNATPYSANDVLSNGGIMEFPNAARQSTGTGYITGFKLVTNDAACVAQIRVHFFGSEPSMVTTDNSPFALLFADANAYLGFIDLPAFATEGSGSDASFAQTTDARLPVILPLETTTIYALMETKTVFTPVAEQQFIPYLTVENN